MQRPAYPCRIHKTLDTCRTNIAFRQTAPEITGGRGSRYTTELMKCPYCGNEARWCSNEERYGKRYGKSHMCYWCRPCDAYVGCHNNTRQPLGTLANKELRQWRMRAHAHIDPLWKSGRIKRSKLYKRLNGYFGKIVHIGEADIDRCKAIVAIPVDELVPPGPKEIHQKTLDLFREKHRI